jgi:hypothetical protein
MSIHHISDAAGPHGVCPISDRARFIVTIDGKPYASFLDRSCAEQAAGMWLGEIDGNGLPVPAHEQHRHAWRAVQGRRVEVIER